MLTRRRRVSGWPRLQQTPSRSDALATTVSKTLQTPEGDGLVMLYVPELALTRDAGVITRKDGWVSPAAAGIIDALKAICAAEAASRKGRA